MPVCAQCGTEYSPEVGSCPDCTPHPARFGVEHDLRLVSVFTAQDEMTARLAHAALTSNGVQAYIHSEQVPMMGTIMEVDHGCWGEVMVPEPYQDRAAEIIRAYTTEAPLTDEDLEDSGDFGEDAILSDAAPVNADLAAPGTPASLPPIDEPGNNPPVTAVRSTDER